MSSNNSTYSNSFYTHLDDPTPMLTFGDSQNCCRLAPYIQCTSNCFSKCSPCCSGMLQGVPARYNYNLAGSVVGECGSCPGNIPNALQSNGSCTKQGGLKCSYY